MRKEDGKTKAYILNLMRHYENQSMNEYELKHKINKRFGYHLRANEVRKLHIENLIKLHWLIETRRDNGEILYIRIGQIRYVRQQETLKDQFIDYPEEMREYMVSYYSQDEIIRDMWQSDPDNFMTEKECEEFWNREWERHLLEEEQNNRKLTPEEIEDLEKSIGINDQES